MDAMACGHPFCHKTADDRLSDSGRVSELFSGPTTCREERFDVCSNVHDAENTARNRISQHQSRLVFDTGISDRYSVPMGVMEQLVESLKAIKDSQFGGNLRAMADFIGVPQPTLQRWIAGTRTPQLSALAPVLDRLQASIVFPGQLQDTAREVCFVDPRIVESGRNTPPPQAEDYVAIPLVGQAGAGPGYVSEEELKSWVLVYRNHPSVQFRSNMIAVELGRDAESMKPTLHPGDIVLVDRSDRNPGHARALFLVREPGQEGGAKVKRVFVHQKNGTTQVIYYSDNAVENPPEVYDLEADFENDISKAIIGRCVWSWSDLTRK